MKIRNSIKVSGAVVIAALIFATRAQAVVAYDFPTGLAGNQTGGAYVLGNEFVVNSAISVTAVGAFDDGANGIGATVPVAIYQLTGSTWNQVSGTLMSFSGTAGTLNGTARFQDLASPVTLSAGTYAIVAANYGAAGASDWNANIAHPGTPLPGFNNGGGLISMTSPNTAFYASGSTLGGTLPTLSYGNWGSPNPAFAGGTFDFTPVPEATVFGVAAVSLLGLVYVVRSARLRRTLKPA